MIQNGVFPFTVAEFSTRGIVYKFTPVYSRRRYRFRNSAFPNEKNLAQKSKFIYYKQKWKQMFTEILCFNLVLSTKNAKGKRRLT